MADDDVVRRKPAIGADITAVEKSIVASIDSVLGIPDVDVSSLSGSGSVVAVAAEPSLSGDPQPDQVIPSVHPSYPQDGHDDTPVCKQPTGHVAQDGALDGDDDPETADDESLVIVSGAHNPSTAVEPVPDVASHSDTVHRDGVPENTQTKVLAPTPVVTDKPINTVSVSTGTDPVTSSGVTETVTGSCDADVVVEEDLRDLPQRYTDFSSTVDQDAGVSCSHDGEQVDASVDRVDTDMNETEDDMEDEMEDEMDEDMEEDDDEVSFVEEDDLIDAQEDDYARSAAQEIAAQDSTPTFVGELIDSMFTPGLPPRVQMIMHASFGALVTVLILLALVTDMNLHVVALLLVSIALWGTTTWFIFASAEMMNDKTMDIQIETTSVTQVIEQTSTVSEPERVVESKKDV